MRITGFNHIGLNAAGKHDEVKEMTDDHLHFGEGTNQIIWFKDPAGNTLELQQDPTSSS